MNGRVVEFRNQDSGFILAVINQAPGRYILTARGIVQYLCLIQIRIKFMRSRRRRDFKFCEGEGPEAFAFLLSHDLINIDVSVDIEILVFQIQISGYPVCAKPCGDRRNDKEKLDKQTAQNKQDSQCDKRCLDQYIRTL